MTSGSDAGMGTRSESADGRPQRIVVITGGSRGLGRAIGLRFADARTALVVNYAHDDGAAHATAEELRARGAQAELVKGDIGDPAVAQTLVATARDIGGRIDVLVHNAFHRTWGDPLETEVPELERAFLTGPVALAVVAQHAAPHFPDAGGSIVCTSSLATSRIFSVRGGVGYFPMAAAKGALEVAVRYLATRLGGANVRVNGVSAGWIETAAEVRPEISRSMGRIRDQTPLGRIATPADIADVVHALTTPALRWVTGQVLIADGGLSLV
jgi:3-oxoacyl-[acyl-carrier protein] reductase